jgi:hypothetical protein
MTFSKEREKLVQLTARHEKLKEELSQQKKEVMDKNKHLDGITAEVKNYNQHAKELMEELQEVQNVFPFLVHITEMKCLFIFYLFYTYS